MASVNAAPRGTRAILNAVLVTVLAPVVAYAAVRNAALDAVGDAADPSAVLLPRSVMPQLKAMMRAARRPEDRLPNESATLAREAAVKLPLAYEPYYIAARAEEQAGRYARATTLMEEARRRRPNATSVRVALLGYYSLADAYQKAINEADLAMRIDSRSMSYILPAFAKLVAIDVNARKAIAVSLATRPPWREAFLAALVKSDVAPATAKALVQDVRRLAPSATPQAEEAFLVQSLAAAGKFREARALLAGYQPAPANPNAVVDPAFRGVPSMPPFAWTFKSGQDGTAEIGKPSAGSASFLEVDYFGDTELTLAEQTLALPPGSYRLSSAFSGGASAPDVGIGWTLKCLGSLKEFGRLQLVPLSESPQRREVNIVVPSSGCEGQSLTLLGQPGDISRTLSAQIASVSLVPASSAKSALARTGSARSQ